MLRVALIRCALLGALALSAAVLAAPGAVASTGAPPTPAPTTAAPPASNGPTVTPKVTICDKYCDARDPALSAAATAKARRRDRPAAGSPCTSTTATTWAGPRSPAAPPATTSGWTARSTPGARGPSGSKLGDTATPSGYDRLADADVQRRRLERTTASACCAPAGSPRGRGRSPAPAGPAPTWNAWDRRTAAATALMERLQPRHRPVRHDRLVELGQRPDRDHRRHPDQRHGQLPLRDRHDVHEEPRRRRAATSPTTTSTTPAGGAWPGWTPTT